MNHWLMKSEPGCFSIDDLSRKPKQTEHWDGVRNYQARNMMRDKMKKGDSAFFYHSSCDIPGIVGIVEIVKEAYPDFTAWDPSAPHFDAKSTPEHPLWFMVDVKLIKKFSHTISLAEIKHHPTLKNMIILRRGNRLSITPVTLEEWRTLIALGSDRARSLARSI